MRLRDEKEEIYNHMFKLHLPYTIIDTGFWHQLTFPKLQSGKVDEHHLMGENELYGDGNTSNLLTDLRDIGRWVAQIIKDPRTLNKKIITWSDELSQNELYALAERVSGERIDKISVSLEEVEDNINKARIAWDSDPTNYKVQRGVWNQEYHLSKYFRADNTRMNALYLGYLDARELYPDFLPISFETFFKEVLDGKVNRPYIGRV